VPGSCPESEGDSNTLVKVAAPGLKATCVDATEVTRGQYENWLTAMDGGVVEPPAMPTYCTTWNDDYRPAADWPPGGFGLDRPVAHVDWCDALGYCKAHDKRLCGAIDGGGSVLPNDYDDEAESEWHNACTERGANAYPYGGTYVPARCNDRENGLDRTADVGSMPDCRGNLPVFDLSGNVWEWENSCEGDMGKDDHCRIRGGGFNNTEGNLGCAADATYEREFAVVEVGFRCCADSVP